MTTTHQTFAGGAFIERLVILAMIIGVAIAIGVILAQIALDVAFAPPTPQHNDNHIAIVSGTSKS